MQGRNGFGERQCGGTGGSASAGTAVPVGGTNGSAKGGGINNDGTLLLYHSTVIDNTPDDLFTDTSATTTLDDATVFVQDGPGTVVVI
jgi:hypothetical protein